VNLFRTLAIALRALASTKSRSLLTVLGVIIGVGAVIAMVSIGEGAKARVAKTFESMGTNMLTVSSGSTRSGGVRGGQGSQPTLTWADLDAIKAQIPGIAATAPQLRSSVQVSSELDNWQTSITGTTAEYFTIRNWPVAMGSLFDAGDQAAGRAVAVLGKTVSDTLFGPGEDPTGQVVRIQGVPFKVVGVLTSKGTSAFGSDNDDTIVIPASTFSRRISAGLDKFIGGSVMISAASREMIPSIESGIETLLRERHRLRDDKENDFSVRNMSEIADAQAESAQTITSLLGGVALVSLIVGGIGIMNIMLVSVTERTREIGLRMSVGARPRDILSQFLVEAIVLSLAGGLLGIAGGVGAAKYMAAKFAFPMLIRPDIVVLALGTSAIVGIVFGLYPATKASRLDPIQALRTE
jgi:putative ABC transport system permease protein